MTLAAEKQMAHIGETKSIADHDHDLIHALSARLDAIWRYDQYIANADGKPELQKFWRDVKSKDREIADRLRELVAREVKENCF